MYGIIAVEHEMIAHWKEVYEGEKKSKIYE
jgi:hypothetical protein